MQIACPSCFARNRVPEERLGEHPACGKCHASLQVAEPIALHGAGFGQFVAASDQPVIVDFWAAWCGPCKMMAPEFAAAARQRPGVRFVKVDTEADGALAARYAIRSIPTMVLLHGGRETARFSGAVGANALLQWLDQQLAGSPA